LETQITSGKRYETRNNTCEEMKKVEIIEKKDNHHHKTTALNNHPSIPGPSQTTNPTQELMSPAKK